MEITKEKEGEALVEEEALVAAEAMEAVAEAMAEVDQEKCTKQSAQTAEKSAKFLSNLQKAGLYTARNAFKNTETRDKDKR